MAGSRIFLQPVLADTVSGIDTSIQSMNTTLGTVNTTLTPIPNKIDQQITQLQAAITAIGASAQQTALKYSYENNITNLIRNYSGTIASGTYIESSVVSFTEISQAFTSYANGSLGFILGFDTANLSGTIKGENLNYDCIITLGVTISLYDSDSTALFTHSETLGSITIPKGTTRVINLNYSLNDYTCNANISANEVYTAKLKFTAAGNGIRAIPQTALTMAVSENLYNFGYDLNNIINNPIVLN